MTQYRGRGGVIRKKGQMLCIIIIMQKTGYLCLVLRDKSVSSKGLSEKDSSDVTQRAKVKLEPILFKKFVCKKS